ncbi:nucleotidyltransferase family protein [Desulfococcaceae bacterium HSG8]|nr:nucleotidyltransferase family protein [Desulfococcaceae bacterium HSG8]
MKQPDFNNRKLLEICQGNDVSFLGLFGSFSRGDATEESDADLLIRFSKRKSLLDLVRIEREMSEILERRVDLLTEASVSPYLTDRIRKEVKVIYDSQT